MKRREKLFSYASKLTGSTKIRVIMVYINEAHSKKWKIGLPHHPEPHKDFQDRIARAQQIVEEYKVPYELYVDGWNNEFETTFRSWPDKYYLIDKDLKVLMKSEYGTVGEQDGKLLTDPTLILESCL